MTTAPAPDPQLVYIDSTFLVDLSLSTEPRHQEALDVLAVFQKHQGSGLLQLRTSAWTASEAHGIFYRKALEKAGYPKPSHSNYLRNIVPPVSAELNAATLLTNSVLANLQTTTDFAVLPQAGHDVVAFWNLATRLGHEAAIWPADSVHVALALQEGCTMLISDDNDLLDKIECCQTNLIQPYRQTEFSQISPLPAFQAHGVRQVTCNISGHTVRLHPPALQALRGLGFQ